MVQCNNFRWLLRELYWGGAVVTRDIQTRLYGGAAVVKNKKINRIVMLCRTTKDDNVSIGMIRAIRRGPISLAAFFVPR